MNTHIIDKYLDFLEHCQLDKIENLFTKDAVVLSPLYGKIAAKDFYTTLFQDSNQSKLSLNLKFISPENPKFIACYFTYQWTMKTGAVSNFNCVDIFELDEDGKIKQLQIVYDTYNTRKEFDALKKHATC